MSVALQKYFKNIEDYTELRQLGQGACGVVFLAEEKVGRAQVAIKHIGEIAEPRDQRSFFREIVVPLKLNLPGIVKLIGFRFPEPAVGGKPAVSALIITELMPHGTLDDVLKKKYAKQPTPGFGPTEYSKTLFGVASTMAQVHKNSAIHRDLKPGNIFFDRDWEPRIADFGLAKIVTNGVKMTMAIGSPMFMAPELFDDDDAYSFAVDVFAYGVMIYTIFTDQKLFKPDDKPPRSPHQLMTRVARGERYLRQPGIPDNFWALIQDCWQQSPAGRPTFASIVQRLTSDDTLVFAGTDMAKYREYCRRMTPPDEGPAAEAPRGPAGEIDGIKMSDLVSRGHKAFGEEQQRATQRSMRAGSGDQAADLALRRYDFTRSKGKK